MTKPMRCCKRNVGGDSQTTVHEWRLIEEKEKYEYLWPTKEEHLNSDDLIPRPKKILKGVTRRWYCIFCRKIEEELDESV